MVSTRSDGRYTREKLDVALAEVCAAAGLDHRGARLLRFVNNGVFLLREHPVVVRIVLAPSLAYRADKVVMAANWLAEQDAPAVRLAPGIEQPVRVGQHLATFWQEVPEVAEPTGSHLGVLLRRFHRMPAPPTLQQWNLMGDIRRKLGDAEELDSGDRSFLEDQCDQLEQELAELDYAFEPGVLHGDAHLANVISGPHGPVLCDLDGMAFGPPEWDLSVTAVGVVRLGHPPERHQQLVEAYGFDVTRWSGFPVFRRLRELEMVASGLPIARSNPDVRAEMRHRLHTIRTGQTTVRWNLYK